MKKFIVILCFLTLSLNLFAFEFLGVEIAGNVEEVADKLAEKGFNRKIGIIQEGPNKGKSEVMKLEDALFLEGEFGKEKALLILRMPNEDEIVNSLFLSFTTSTFFEAIDDWESISKELIKQYGEPTYKLDLRGSDEEYILLNIWEFRDYEINMHIPSNKPIILISIHPI